MRTLVFDIQRFALHDGPGIRTTVFVKGCPLRCLWCHNPESQSFLPHLSFRVEKCMDCLSCVAVCPTRAHRENNAKHFFDRTRCETLGCCVEVCANGALRLIGQELSVESVLSEVVKDRAYYERTGGGMTVSGGEPLAHIEFTEALLAEAKSAGIHTCLDTSGYATTDKLERLLDLVDLFLFDYKATDPKMHRQFTGVCNRLILQNLDYLYRNQAEIMLRCPLVPGVNDSRRHLAGIAALLGRYPKLAGVEILPYHNLGRDKAERIGITPAYATLPAATESTKLNWLQTLQGFGCHRVRIG